MTKKDDLDLTSDRISYFGHLAIKSLLDIENGIKIGDFVAINEEGVTYKPTIEDCKNRRYFELYRYVVTTTKRND